MLQHNDTLKSLIDKLWDRFWSGGISNPLSAIEQITYLLFMKQLDELDLKQERDAKFTGDTYMSRFSGTFKLPNTPDRRRFGDMADDHRLHLRRTLEIVGVGVDGQYLRRPEDAQL